MSNQGEFRTRVVHLEMDEAFDGSGYVYSRFGNPTVEVFERAVAELEGAAGAVAFGSGMAALHAAITSLIPGRAGPAEARRHLALAASRDCYGGTSALISGPLTSLGIASAFVDFTNPNEVEQALARQPRLILLEITSNPLLRVVDFPRLAELAHAVGARVIVDSTFSTPYLCRPLEHGADVVVHSATKFLSGHGDVTAGVIAGREDVVEPIRQSARLIGGVLGPHEAWLASRGMKTLALRMDRQCQNAQELAGWLEGHPAVERVYYPGLPSHPQHDLARKILRGGFGAVVSFDLRHCQPEAATAFIDRLKIFVPAPTVGDVESLVMYPARASHRGLGPEERRRIGIGDGLIRLSVGIEAVEDLRRDLEQALREAS